MRFICHFLIVWLALLAGGAHAYAAADAAHEVGHIAVQASSPQTANATEATTVAPDQVEKMGKTQGHDHTESCKLSHCGHGHATGMLPNLSLRLSDAPAGAPLPRAQAWVSREQPNNIERPKWVHTTSSVVNL